MSRQSKNTRNRAHAQQFAKGAKGPAQTIPVHGKRNRIAVVTPSKVTIRLQDRAKENPSCVAR